MKSINRIIAAVLAAMLAALSVPAQKETPPAGGPPKPFVFPAVETYKLKNGLTVSLVPYGDIEKVQIVAKIRAGSGNEKPGKRWISDAVTALLKEGTTTQSAEAIARLTAEMGGNLFTSAGTDRTTVGGEVLSDFDVKFIELLADVMLRPKFAPDDLETFRTNKLRELALSVAQPGTVAVDAFRKAIYPGHYYGEILPSEETVKGYTIADVKDYYDANYGAARTHIYIVGKYNASRVKETIEKQFGGWKSGPAPTRNVPAPTAKRSLTVIDRPGAPQSTIYMGVPAPSQSDADYVPFMVMDSILGGSFGSRITSNIREDKGYTYSPFSSVFGFYKAGFWYESADVTTASTGASIKEILFEIERLRKEPPSAAELQGIKNNMIGIYVLQNSARAGVVNALDTMNYNDLDKSSIDGYVSKVNAVTPEQVREMASKYLDAAKMTIVVVGDRKVIDEQLKPYEK